MEKHIEILRLKYDCGLAHRTIHDALGVSIGTICNVLKRARAAGIGWPLPAGIDAHRLRAVLYPVPDNLRSAVTRSCRYDPQMNRQFVQWAHHYSVCIMPARVRKPQDKSIAEIAVNLVQMKVLAPLRKVQFHSLGELNAKIAPLLDQANNRPFQKRAGSRAQVFETLDRPALKSLPLIRYQLVDSHLAKVGFDYHIYHQKHWYSVPYQFVGKTVEVQDCAHTVRISYGQDLIAMHLKAQHRHPNQTTDLKHMPQAHQHIGNWTPGRLLGWAARIGSDCHIWVQAQLERAEHFHKVSRLCIGVLSLSKKFGKPSLNRACRIANEQHIERLGLIKTIVTNDLNRRTDTRQLTLNLPQDHANVRGPRHFK